MGNVVNLVYHFAATDSRDDTSDSAQWVDLYRRSLDDLNLMARPLLSCSEMENL